MRKTFIQTLTELARHDERIFLLTGDLGFMVLDDYIREFPDRFINVGVAEQNMVGIATGLAEAGYIPFVYSIVTFATLRPYEFIRNGPLLHNLPVRIVGVGGGLQYGSNGVTHYGLEDIAVMRTQPGMTIIAPTDFQQTQSALTKTWDRPGPIYYRLGKDNPATLPGLHGAFDIGRAQQVLSGSELLIVATGGLCFEAHQAAEMLKKQGISASLVVVASLQPAPSEDLKALLAVHPLVMTVEEHYANGGLGSLVAELIAENGFPCRLTRAALREMPTGFTGSQKYLHQHYGLSADALVQQAQLSLNEGLLVCPS